MKLFAILLLAFSAAGQTAADLVLVNGNVRTLDDKKPRVTALAVADGRIIAAGSDVEIKKLSTGRTKTIDAGGRLVLPGFNDAHVHFAAIGNRFSHLDLRDSDSVASVLERIGHNAQFLPAGRWLMGGSLRESIAASRELLDRLDAVTPLHPVFIYLTDTKRALVNRKAAGGVARVVTGEELMRIRRLVPADHSRNLPEIVETASNYAASLGVTSVQDVHSDDLFEVLRGLDRAGKLKTRVYDCLGIADWKRLADANLKPTKDLAMARRGCVKGFATDETDEKSFSQIKSADAAGLQVMIHAIGERDVRAAVSSFARAVKENGQRDRRFRVEHASGLSSSDQSRMSSLGIIASMQPYLFYGSDDNYREIVSRGVRLALGSDASMTDFNPLRAIKASVTAGDGHSLTIEQAINAHTLGSAFAEFQEGVKGSLGVGKAADFVILSDDVFVIDASKTRDIRVVMTITNGTIVYEAK